MIRNTIAILAVLAMTGACASTGATTANESATATPLDLTSNDVAAQGLLPVGDAKIPSSECGMVLWSLEGARPAAVFQFVSGKEAQVNIAGRQVKLTRTDYSGASGFGVFERQRFENGDGLVIDVSARFGMEFSEGAYLEHGLIKLNDSTGWSMVSPAAGIAGCRP